MIECISSLNLAKMISLKVKPSILVLKSKSKMKLPRKLLTARRAKVLISTENLLCQRGLQKDWRCAFRAHLTRKLSTRQRFRQFCHSIQKFEAHLQSILLNSKSLRRATKCFFVVNCLILLQDLKKGKSQSVIFTSKMIWALWLRFSSFWTSPRSTH